MESITTSKDKADLDCEKIEDSLKKIVEKAMERFSKEEEIYDKIDKLGHKK